MTPNQVGGTHRIFDYTEEPVGHWTTILDQYKEAGVRRLITKIPWGAHESLRGVRDFSKSSRLRLERFLSLAQERRFEIELRLGFFASAETFPSWTLGLPKKTALSLHLWEERGDGFSQTEIPSLENPELWPGFLEFVDEVFGICALYRRPEGPVARLVIDIGVYRAGLSMLESERYPDLLRRRYQTIEKLNLVYNTSFRDFESLATKAGGRVLADKRAWLAAFDYKWCREQYLNEFFDRVAELSNIDPVFELVSRRGEDPTESRNQYWMMLQDDVLVEPAHDGAAPCLAPGLPSPSTAVAYRLFDYLRAHCESSNTDLGLIPSFEEMEPVSKPLAAVACGKYISRKSFRNLTRYIAGGGNLIFPMGLPQYDEQMQRLEWGADRVAVKFIDQRFSRIPHESGSAWVPDELVKFEDGLWETVQDYVLLVEEGVRQL